MTSATCFAVSICLISSPPYSLSSSDAGGCPCMTEQMLRFDCSFYNFSGIISVGRRCLQ
nr:MAG TPA_asm: hypothetical protein [Caudoviricetes sp.]